MNIAITGSTGLIGTALTAMLTGAGHKVSRIVRTKPKPGSSDIFWDPAAAYVDNTRLEGQDAVVHRVHDSKSRGGGSGGDGSGHLRLLRGWLD